MRNIKTNKLRVYRVLVGIDNDRMYLFSQSGYEAALFLRQRMSDGIVDFCYRKANGTITRRRGTLDPVFIASQGMTFKSSSEKYRHPNVLVYWDVDAGYWRSALTDNLIGYYEDTKY